MHDAGIYTGPDNTRIATEFEPGMVLTVEPGLYFNPCDMEIPEKYRGIAIRIEDDIVITETGIINLTASLGKELTDF